MTKAIFDYDHDAVCSSCGTNDQVHYNLFLFHGKSYFMDDPNIAVWCGHCDGEAHLIDPDCYEPSE